MRERSTTAYQRQTGRLHTAISSVRDHPTRRICRHLQQALPRNYTAWRRISSSSSSKLTPAGTAHSRPRQLTAYAASREISEMKYAGSWIRPFGPAHFSGALRPDHKNCVARTVLNSARTWANQLSMLNRFVFDLCFSWATQT